jgi:hypothetical protein
MKIQMCVGAACTCYTLSLHWNITAETREYCIENRKAGRRAGGCSTTEPKAFVSYANDVVPDHIPVHSQIGTSRSCKHFTPPPIRFASLTPKSKILGYQSADYEDVKMFHYYRRFGTLFCPHNFGVEYSTLKMEAVTCQKSVKLLTARVKREAIPVLNQLSTIYEDL